MISWKTNNFCKTSQQNFDFLTENLDKVIIELFIVTLSHISILPCEFARFSLNSNENVI